METKYIDQVFIKHGDRYVTAVTKDHNLGLVVQVARMNPTHVRGDNGTVYKGHEPVIMWQTVVPLGVKKQTGDIDFRDASSIDSDLKAAIGRASHYAEKCKQAEDSVDVILAALDKAVSR